MVFSKQSWWQNSNLAGWGGIPQALCQQSVQKFPNFKRSKASPGTHRCLASLIRFLTSASLRMVMAVFCTCRNITWEQASAPGEGAPATAGSMITHLKLPTSNHMDATPALETYYFLQTMGTNSKAVFPFAGLTDNWKPTEVCVRLGDQRTARTRIVVWPGTSAVFHFNFSFHKLRILSVHTSCGFGCWND